MDSAVAVLKQVCTQPVESEFDIFGKHVAVQLQQLPMQDAVQLQADIQALLTRARLRSLSQMQPSSRFNPSTNRTRQNKEAELLTTSESTPRQSPTSDNSENHYIQNQMTELTNLMNVSREPESLTDYYEQWSSVINK